MSGKEGVFRVTKLIQSMLRRVGLEFQVMPAPRRTSIVKTDDHESTLLNSSVNWLRVPMYEGILSSLNNEFGPNYFNGKLAVEIGGSEGSLAKMIESLGITVQIAPNYPTVDIEKLPFAPGSFDVVLLDQTFEHLKRPWKAVEQVKSVLRPKGVCICTSVFVYPIHKGGNYEDYYRFSPEGFRALFEGFRVVSSDGWGSAEVLRIVYNHSDRGPEGPFPMTKAEANRRGLYDYSDKMNYLTTWCIAQKT